MQGLELNHHTTTQGQVILTGGLALLTFNKKGTTHMRKIQALLIAFMFALTGCPDEPKPPTPEELKHEQQKRKEAEAQKDREAASKGNWQAVAFITGIGAILLLITGTILGSMSRKDDRRQ